jgi:hypothetical protein
MNDASLSFVSQRIRRKTTKVLRELKTGSHAKAQKRKGNAKNSDSSLRPSLRLCAFA